MQKSMEKTVITKGEAVLQINKEQQHNHPQVTTSSKGLGQNTNQHQYLQRLIKHQNNGFDSSVHQNDSLKYYII